MFKDAGTLRKPGLNVADYLRILGKKVAGCLCVVRPAQRPIFVFSLRRSGSTVFMRMLASQPGVDYIDEPLNLWRLHPHFERLPHSPHGCFITLVPEHEGKLYGYLEDLLVGRARFRHRGNLLDPGRTFFVRRLVVKSINATPLIDWFTQRFDADIVYLVRHPGAVAESLMRRRWSSAAEAYLEDQSYCGRYLSSDQVRYAQHVLQQGNDFQKCVLGWCLGNLHPLMVWRKRPWLTLSYEEVVLRSLEVSRLICDRLDMPKAMRMAQVVAKPSRTTTRQSRRDIVERGPRHLVERWLGQVRKDDLECMQETLDVFQIQVYRADSPFPCPGLCYFGPLGSRAACKEEGSEECGS